MKRINYKPSQPSRRLQGSLLSQLLQRYQRFRKSLLYKYIAIILTAMVIIPILLPLSFLSSWVVNSMLYPNNQSLTKRLPYGSAQSLKEMWHAEAEALASASADEINQRLTELKDKYADASLFWVDSEGQTQLQLPKQPSLPDQWTANHTIAFMKKAYNADPYTIVAFIGGEQNVGNGFMVFELPRYFLNVSTEREADRFYLLFFILLLGTFFCISYLFFKNIRRRLVRLESAMTHVDEDGLPTYIPIAKSDEIGNLEQAFNHMVYQLKSAQTREREEEQLRKNLIANLSHDLRTPLTVLGSHLYSLRQEPLSEEGHQAIHLMETKLKDLDHLIDHLLSYNLLTSGRYPMSINTEDVYRIIRESAAAWYPVWEKAGLEVDLNLPDEPLLWNIDAQGFRRVLDNIFQNTVRHAASGQYIGIRTTLRNGKPAIVISDRGPGLEGKSKAKGAGLGLAIVKLLLREMKLTMETKSSDKGLQIILYPTLNEI